MLPESMDVLIKIRFSAGRLIIVLQNLGDKMRRTGSIPITSSASICCVDFIKPISAVIEEPTRPAKSSDVMIGDISRMITVAKATPVTSAEP